MTASASLSKGNITLSGDDAANYKLVLDKDTYTISATRKLTLPAALKNGQFTRSALERQYNLVYRFTEEDGALPGDDVYLYDDSQRGLKGLGEIGTHELKSEYVYLSDDNYDYDKPEEWEGATFTLTVTNDETFRFVREDSIIRKESATGLLYTKGYVLAGQVAVGDTIYFSHNVKAAEVKKIEDGDGNSIEKASRFEYDSVKLYFTSSDVNGLFNSINRASGVSIWGDAESAKSIPQFKADLTNFSTTECKLYATPRFYFAPDLWHTYASNNDSFVDLGLKGMYVSTAEIVEIRGSDNKPISSIPAGETRSVTFEFDPRNAFPVQIGDEFVSFLASSSGKAALVGKVTSVHTHLEGYYKTGYCDEELDGGCGYWVTTGTFAMSDEKTYTISIGDDEGVNTGQYGFYEITLPEGKLFEFSLKNSDGDDITNSKYHAMYNNDGTTRRTISTSFTGGTAVNYTGYTGPDSFIVVIHPDIPLYYFQMTFTQVYPTA